VHLAGPAHFDAAQRAASGAGLEIEVLAFEADMARRYAAADLVLSRAGATGLAEMAVCGLPAVLVPFPFAKDNHQEANGRAFERAGAARVLLEAELTGAKLADVLCGLLEDRNARIRMAECMKGMSRPEAGERIAARLLEMAGGGRAGR
jgi:UDP-N-acetylglucosamine--N-acetylmuramyl-(pentapeptide) pyrophosphoryl-undecaprenol N-acetylglucosamine transferase